MKRLLIVSALSATLAGIAPATFADTPAPAFSDDSCPQANASGRKLNELNASGKASSDEITAAAQGLVDAYKDCAHAFDQSVNSKNADHQSDYVPVERSYARLQLARAYQRLGSFAEQLHDPQKAIGYYQSALESLDQLDVIMNGLDRSGSNGESHIMSNSASLRGQLKTSLAGMPSPVLVVK